MSSKSKDINASSLPMKALTDIPTAKADAQHIKALVKEDGYVTGYQLSDGQKLEKAQAIDLAREGVIAGVGIAHRKEREYLKSLPDETQANNLSNLPSIAKEKTT